MSALTNILANLSGSSASQAGGSATGSEAAAAAKPAIDLYDIMNTEVNRRMSFSSSVKTFLVQNLVPILSNKDVQERLRAHLPEGQSIPNNERELRESIQSPQFRQAVGTFGFVN